MSNVLCLITTPLPPAKLSDERTYTYCGYEYTSGIENPTMVWTGSYYYFGDVQRVYMHEPLRDVVTNVSNYSYGSRVSSYGYDNDAIGRRTNRVDVTPSLTLTNAFGYNLKSEVTSATMANGESIYDYDSIGNRIQSAVAVGSGQSETNTYSANALNQYSCITNFAFSASSCETLPFYDLDGNILTNGVWSYTWDAENRMTSACSNGLLLITNSYDDQSRRIAKSVFEITQSGTNVIRQFSFLYDGWNPVREVRVQGSGVSTNYYCWGTDLSGSLQGAGGVGGLQAVIVDGETPATYYPCYDANGNITAYVDELGDVRAEFSYDAFGNTITLELSNFSTLELSPFSHRFSTKYADDETGLYYYGYRYYSSELGRWVNRDPIEEGDDSNLYVYVGNCPLAYCDVLGLWKKGQHTSLTSFSMTDAKAPDTLGTGVDTVLKWLIYWNNQQDEGEAFDDLRRHFNRKIDKPIGSQAGSFMKSYAGYLVDESFKFSEALKGEKPTQKECATALDALGRLVHTWQDYYAHSVILMTNEKGKGGGASKILWTADPPKKGSPDNPSGDSGRIVPSSWNKWNDSGEHGWSEPDGLEGDARQKGARDYVTNKLKNLLPFWALKCKCHCPSLGTPK